MMDALLFTWVMMLKMLVFTSLLVTVRIKSQLVEMKILNLLVDGTLYVANMKKGQWVANDN